jgi:cytidine deaminase
MTLDPEPDAEALAAFPPSARATLRDAISPSTFAGTIAAATVAESIESAQSTVDAVMTGLVPLARSYAHPPISGFRVGAVAQGLVRPGMACGNLYLGANLEFNGASLGLAVHAEQAAVANAWMSGEHGLTSIAVSAPPCGHCRQFLFELSTASTLRILLPSGRALLLADLLPDAFGPADLKKGAALMKPQRHALRLPQAVSDPLARAALAAARASHAPYSKSYAGVALETRGGSVLTGRYAENAAFNPSLSPMGAALAMWRLRGRSDDAIVRAWLVQRDGGAGLEGSCRQALHAVSRARLRVGHAMF